MEISFVFPNERPLILELISLIKNGTCVSGGLIAPLEMITTREAIGHTGFRLTRFSSINSVVQTFHPQEDSRSFSLRSQNRQDREKEGLFAILVHRKYPGFVRFKDAGWEGSPMAFNVLQEIIANFLGLGYRGGLHYLIGGL